MEFGSVSSFESIFREKVADSNCKALDLHLTFIGVVRQILAEPGIPDSQRLQLLQNANTAYEKVFYGMKSVHKQ
ncbi:hypothetical protein [Effusibacillus consociatus]|uniref:Globin-sensor domain-containing protein n=1 Tax=Effusibacillus consociatus TaxID=1117041 RepID=A0ABV9Q1Z2_9BACL